jgi:hypothetical protein
VVCARCHAEIHSLKQSPSWFFLTT